MYYYVHSGTSAVKTTLSNALSELFTRATSEVGA